MTDREEQQARRIAGRLNLGLEQIDVQVLARLRSARETALAQLQHQPAWSLSPAGVPGARPWGLRYLNPRYILPVVTFLFVILGAVYWQQSLHHDDVADIDAKLLSGDLPIDAYLDKGLDSWLKRTSH